jgi:hypothetical protein
MESIKKIWKTKAQILEGIKNSIFTSETVEQIATERLKECESCENIDPEGDSCTVPGSAPCCRLCGCCLHLATRSLSYQCRAGKWDYLPENDSQEITIALNYKSHLKALLEEGKVTIDEHNILLDGIMSTDKKQAITARFKIRAKL